MISKLLVGWSDLWDMGTTDKPSEFAWLGTIFNTITIVMYVIMGLVGAAGAIYAIYLGIQLARAEDQSKRDDAKKHLITVFIAVAVTIVLVLFFNLLLPEIVKAFFMPKNSDGTNKDHFNMISPLINIFR
jgi:H+/Cl- antiporter ClcA